MTENERRAQDTLSREDIRQSVTLAKQSHPDEPWRYEVIPPANMALPKKHTGHRGWCALF
jgi:hypothetical protein